MNTNGSYCKRIYIKITVVLTKRFRTVFYFWIRFVACECDRTGWTVLTWTMLTMISSRLKPTVYDYLTEFETWCFMFNIDIGLLWRWRLLGYHCLFRWSWFPFVLFIFFWLAYPDLLNPDWVIDLTYQVPVVSCMCRFIINMLRLLISAE